MKRPFRVWPLSPLQKERQRRFVIVLPIVIRSIRQGVGTTFRTPFSLSSPWGETEVAANQ